MTRRPLRIGNYSGYLGDRPTALAEVLAGEPLDVVFGDHLAEVTLAALTSVRRKDPARAYVPGAVEQLRPHLRTLIERGTRLVTDAGGFSPAGLAAALREAAASDGVALHVAHIEGDDVLDRWQELRHLDNGGSLKAAPMAANAYLGGWGIAAALAAGADVVVCGRVTDASMVVGPAAWWHGWALDDWDRLAGAVVAGHLLECGPHVTGGNFSGFTALGDLTVPAFPYGEVADDGSAVITKSAGTGGSVIVDTVTAQLLYEIQGPIYLNPDVTVDLSAVRLEQNGPDRVGVSGAAGLPAPPTTKVATFGVAGHQVVGTLFLTAPEIEAKAALVRAQVGRDLPEGVALHWTQVGVAAAEPASQWEATVAFRVLASGPDRASLEELDLATRLGSLYLQSIPGFFHDLAAGLSLPPRARVEYWPGLLDQREVAHCVLLDDGRTLPVQPPPLGLLTEQPPHEEPAPLPVGEVRTVPLGRLAHARSGDKGGHANVGLWVSDPAAWPWLRSALTVEGVRRLAPELADVDVIRHELPHLRAVHLVLRGVLGTGGSSNARLDAVGKALGEYLRTRPVPVPVELLPD